MAAKSVELIVRDVPLVAVEELAYHQPVVSSNLTEVRLVQPRNAFFPILVTLLGMVIVVKLLQLENAELPMLVTLLGMVIVVKPVQTENA